MLIYGESRTQKERALHGTKILQLFFCRLDDWLISNTLHDLVKTTDIIPSIKTDQAAISLELINDSNDIKGPGLWKMNCSLLDDEDYVNDITEKIAIWLAEGRKDLSDSRSIWSWLKYNIRAHTIRFSKRIVVINYPHGSYPRTGPTDF